MADANVTAATNKTSNRYLSQDNLIIKSHYSHNGRFNISFPIQEIGKKKERETTGFWTIQSHFLNERKRPPKSSEKRSRLKWERRKIPSATHTWILNTHTHTALNVCEWNQQMWTYSNENSREGRSLRAVGSEREQKRACELGKVLALFKELQSCSDGAFLVWTTSWRNSSRLLREKEKHPPQPTILEKRKKKPFGKTVDRISSVFRKQFTSKFSVS